ncbi:putative glycine hydroxymethyltransferase [Medicago truncatula]|uniref:Putative glycine hydroxymethyltransferase n=1 Tax=Medicago truncatula TaxID=3880 RepID=A0A396JVK1_MEDTR|nr:putative glycine hydroxymethyltransferase [Medicago truncatula]
MSVIICYQYLNLTHKGHLSHNFASQYFEIMPYRLDESTDLIGLEKTAAEFRPKLIVASVYPPDVNYSRIRKIADEVGAFFMMDMTHILGFVAESVLADPFEFCDIVATATLKVCVIVAFQHWLKLGVNHFRPITFIHTIVQVVANCIALANRLVEHGYKLVSGGNDNHMVLVDLGQFGIDGALVKKILNMAFINGNKNLVSGDKNALVSNGISIGTKAMTTRGFNEKEFELFADLIHEGVLLSFEAKSLVLGSMDQDFMNVFISPEFSLGDKVSDLRRKVQALAPSSGSKMFGYGLRFYEFCDIA